MSSSKEDQKSYLKLAQIYNSFQNEHPVARIIVRVVRKEGDINYKLPEHSSLKSSQPELIGCTALHIAAIKGYVNVFNLFLNQGADFTLQSQLGRSALHCVDLEESQETHEDLIDTVLTAHIVSGDSTNPCDKNGVSHFHIACLKNHVRAVEFFLDMGIPVDEPVNSDSPKFAGYTPLHFAVKGYALETVYLLLKHHADLNSKDAKGMSPLHALLKNKLTLLNRLHNQVNDRTQKQLQAVDDILDLLSTNHTVDCIGLSKLHIICSMQESSSVEYFLNRTRDLNHQVNMNSPVFPGYSALHFAVQFNVNTAKLLLKRGANHVVKDAEGKTPLEICLENRDWKALQSILRYNHEWKTLAFENSEAKLVDFLSVIQDPVIPSIFYNYLRDAVKDVNNFIPHSSSLWPGFTPLHFAVLAYEETSATIPLCLVQGADATVRDKRGWTPLHLAFRYNKVQAVKWLLNHHYELANPTDKDNLSHLHIACAVGHIEFVDRLQYSFDFNIIYTGETAVGLITPGSTLLHVAIASGSSKIVEVLLNHNMDLEAKDASGQTPVHRFFKLSQNVKEVGRTLLKSQKLKDHVLEKVGLSRIHLAVYCEDMEEIEKSEANIDVAVNCDDPTSFWFRYNGCTALLMALEEKSKVEFLDRLLQRGADILAKGPDGMTPLFKALSSHCDKYVVDAIVGALKINEKTQAKLANMSGITMLHVACRIVDAELVKLILNDQKVNVNSKVNLDCPIEQGNTPLHMLLKNNKCVNRCGILDNLQVILEMLLARGADVSIKNQNGETPIHLLFEQFMTDQRGSGEVVYGDYERMDLLIERLQDFSENPTNAEGVSHFHAACMVNNVEAVGRFLETNVNVNQPIDFFATSYAGYTPLHLTLNNQFKKRFGTERRLCIVDMLLRYGVNSCAEDSHGNTPLHKAICKHPSLDIIDKLASYGSTITAKNLLGETPLENTLKLEQIPLNVMRFFANLGCRLNSSNEITEVGYFSIIISEYYHRFSNQSDAYDIMLDAEDLISVDPMGRIAIHNIVTTPDPASGIFDYADLMETFFENDYDVDLQDKRGKTALHLASQFGNVMAVEALLNLGANVNLFDRSGQTALFYALKYYDHCKRCPIKQCHKKTIQCLASHIRKLQIFKLDVEQHNTYFMHAEVPKLCDVRTIDLRLSGQIERTKQIVIEQEPKLILHDFLSEKKAFLDYPFMTEERRNVVDDFFRMAGKNINLEVVKDLCKLQYRKAVKRIRLIDSAANLMHELAGSPVPQLCQQIIFAELTNSDIENFITAMFDFKFRKN